MECKDEKIKKLESEVSDLKETLQEVLACVREGSARAPSSSDGQNEVEQRMTIGEEQVHKDKADKSAGEGEKDRKPALEHKAVRNRSPLTDDKNKFREWSIKLINSMGQVDK